jgi:hypothetical protein
MTPPLPGMDDPAPRDGVLHRLGLAGCVRLALQVDARQLAAELAALPATAWQESARDPVVHADVESFFVIGHPRGRVPLPPEDRAVLAELTQLRAVLRDAVPAPPLRAIVQRLRAGGMIPIHTDTRRYFASTVRLSFQVSAGGPHRLFCDGAWYASEPGEVWALDNLEPHGVLNDGTEARVNVVADYEPSPALVALLRTGTIGLGRADAAASALLAARTRRHYRRRHWQSLRYELAKLWRRRALVTAPAQDTR